MNMVREEMCGEQICGKVIELRSPWVDIFIFSNGDVNKSNGSIKKYLL